MRTNLIKAESLNTTSGSMLDMVIAFDTTGSMRSYIDAVKDHVKELIPTLFKQNPDLRIGIVAFGDYYDMPSNDIFGNAYQVCPLTNDENKLIDFITNAKNTSGGDTDEFYELVIKKITEQTEWRENSVKAVLLIADACPHPIGYTLNNKVINNQISWREEAKKAAEKGIKFDTLSITNVTWYRELSEITGGVNAPFSSNSKTNDLITTAALARGGEATKELYYATMDSFTDDPEMSAVYAAYSKEVIS